jgi:hypothetical protein
VAVTRPAQDAARAALFEAFGVKPFLDSFEPEPFLVFVVHEKPGRQKYLKLKLYIRE